jgi:hypothetical protein
MVCHNFPPAGNCIVTNYHKQIAYPPIAVARGQVPASSAPPEGFVREVNEARIYPSLYEPPTPEQPQVNESTAPLLSENVGVMSPMPPAADQNSTCPVEQESAERPTPAKGTKKRKRTPDAAAPRAHRTARPPPAAAPLPAADAEGDGPEYCRWDGCNRGLRSKTELEAHLKEVHLHKDSLGSVTERKPRFCLWSGCTRNAPCVKRDQLFAHMETHHRNPKFMCSVCQTGYPRVGTLRVHQRANGCATRRRRQQQQLPPQAEQLQQDDQLPHEHQLDEPQPPQSPQ